MFRRKNNSSEESQFSLDQKNLKNKINKNLGHIVKGLQRELPSGSPVQSESSLAQHLCSVLEAAFIHGLKSSYYEKDSTRSTSRSNFPKPQFWNFILKISHIETIERVESLTFVSSRVGKCRAWLRLTLNDGAMTSYLATILSREEKSTLSHYYDKHALLQDHEHADIFLRQLQGIEILPFELSFNSSILNDWTKTPLELAGLVAPSTSVPLYLSLQSSVENNNFPNRLAVHRGSAPADFFKDAYSKSLPSVSGDEYIKRRRENGEYGKDNSRKLESTIDEEEEPAADAPDESSAPANAILHKRKLIKKRRKRSISNSKGALGSWSSISSSESQASGSYAGSARNTPRSRSFCETPPTAMLQRKVAEMSLKKLIPDSKLNTNSGNSSSGDNLSADDGIFKTSTPEKLPEKLSCAKDRKNRNLMLTPTHEKKPSIPSERTDILGPFDSFPPDVIIEQSSDSVFPSGGAEEHSGSGLEDSTDSHSSSSNNMQSKLATQTSNAYKISFVTSSSSGPDESKDQKPQGYLEVVNDDIMNQSSEAIDIYSRSARDDVDTNSSVSNSFEHVTPEPVTPGKLGNSLSRIGGWSAPNTPDIDQSNPKSPAKSSSGFESSLSPNMTSSLEETHEVIKWSPVDTLDGKVPGFPSKVTEIEEKAPEIFIRREGILRKMGETLKQWKTRYFVLRGTTLSYFKTKDSETPIGVIDLLDVLSISEEGDKEHGTYIVMTMNDETKHHLVAENKSTTLDWAEDLKMILNEPGAVEAEKSIEKLQEEESIYSNNYLDEYEIISVANNRLNGTNTSWYASMIALMGKIANEKGLDSQNYQCADCASPIGIIYGAPRVCGFTGQYYCSQCHANEESQIPARIIHNWDFRKQKVSKRSKSFIEQVFSDPLLNLNELNPGIYKYIDEIGKFLQLRQQLVHLKPYLQTCRSFDMEDLVNKLGAHLHFLDDVHLYSMQDLCNVHDKSLITLLSKIVTNGIKHIYACDLCSAKGFLCEICRKDKIIFPFEIDSTVQCSECKSVFHRECKNESCPKCERRQLRMIRNAESNYGIVDEVY